MRWVGLILGSLLMLAALPAPGKDQPKKDQSPTFRQCVVRHDLASGSMSLSRMIGSSGNTDLAKLSVKGMSLFYDSEFTLAMDARYFDRSTVADPQTSKITISTTLRKAYERPKPKERYALRVYGAAGPIDFPLDEKKVEAEVTLPLADFDARFGTGDVLDMAILTTYGDGSQGELDSSRIDLRAWRKRIATIHSLRAALDALPPGPDTSCITDNLRDIVTFSYDCSRKWSDALGEYEVDGGRVDWTGSPVPGVKASLSQRIQSDELPGIGKLFHARFELTGDAAPRIQPNARLWIGERPAPRGEDLSDAMAGILPIRVVFEKAGQPDRRVDLPPTLFRDVVARLLSGYDAMLEDELAPVGRCKVSRDATDPTQPQDIVI